MTTQEFYALRGQIAENQMPYKVVERAAIKYVGRIDKHGPEVPTKACYGRNIFSVNGTDMLATDHVARTLDKYAGFSRQQQKFIAKASGEDGVRDFRNYLAAASSIADPGKVVLVADPDSHTVINVIPVKDGPITSESFFDFAEMFIDANDLTPTGYQMGYNVSSGITLLLDNNTPDVRAFAQGEDTLINSYYLRWNLGQIELGRYYERLVCSNGATQLIPRTNARITDLDEKSIKGILSIPKDEDMLNSAYNGFVTNALTAIKTRASISELQAVSKLLEKYLVSKDAARQIAPYGDEMEYYINSGYTTNGKWFSPHEALASMTVWELFNDVTQYATHNTEWSKDDNRRTMLQGEIVQFLNRSRDIKTYIDAFAR